MFQSLGVNAAQVYSDLYLSWLRDTHDKNTPDSLQIFRDIVEDGFRERQVILPRQRLGINCASSLATILHRSPIVKLDLHGNNLRDSGVEVLAHLMRDLPNLVYVDIGANGIGAGFATANNNNNNNNNNGGSSYAGGGTSSNNKDGTGGGGGAGLYGASSSSTSRSPGDNNSNNNNNNNNNAAVSFNGIRLLSYVVAQHRRLSTLILGSASNDAYANCLTPAAATILLEGCLRSRALRALDLSGNPICPDPPSYTGGSGGGNDKGLHNNNNSNAEGSFDGDGYGTGGNNNSNNNNNNATAAAGSLFPPAGADGNNNNNNNNAMSMLQGQSAARRPVDLLDQLLRSSTTLVSLKLRDVKLTSAGAVCLLEALQQGDSSSNNNKNSKNSSAAAGSGGGGGNNNNKNASGSVLEVLDLSYNHLNSSVAECAGRLLAARSSLQCQSALHTLVLSGNDVFDTIASRPPNDYGVRDKMERQRQLQEYYESVFAERAQQSVRSIQANEQQRRKSKKKSTTTTTTSSNNKNNGGGEFASSSPPTFGRPGENAKQGHNGNNGGVAAASANGTGDVSRIKKNFPQLAQSGNADGAAATSSSSAAAANGGGDGNNDLMLTEDGEPMDDNNNNDNNEDEGGEVKDPFSASQRQDFYPGGTGDGWGFDNSNPNNNPNSNTLGAAGGGSSSSYSYYPPAQGPPPPLLLTALAHDKVLRSLSLDACGVTDAVLVHLCRSLATNQGLTELSLKGNMIGSGGAVELGRALCRHAGLRRLHLASNALGDEGTCALAALLEDGGSASSLEWLDLRRVRLGDRGLIALGVALRQNTSLRALFLSDNHFTNNGGESFAALVEKNEGLIDCRLGATSVPHHVRLRLQRATDANANKLKNTEARELRRELVRLQYQKYKLDEAKTLQAATQDKHADTKRAAENFDLQFKQDQSDSSKKIREATEQIENYTSQEQKYRQQAEKLQADLVKARAQFEEDMEVAAERLRVESAARAKVEEEYNQVEAHFNDLKNNAQGREAARREELAALKKDKEEWAAQRRDYKTKMDEMKEELAALEERFAAAGLGGGGGGKGNRSRSASVASNRSNKSAKSGGSDKKRKSTASSGAAAKSKRKKSTK